MDNMAIILQEGTKEKIEEKFAELQKKAKNQYPKFYHEIKEDTFEIKTADLRISFSMDLMWNLSFEKVYAIYQIFY